MGQGAWSMEVDKGVVVGVCGLCSGDTAHGVATILVVGDYDVSLLHSFLQLLDAELKYSVVYNFCHG